MIDKNIICCYYSTEVEPCGHPSIHIPKLLMVKYFPKHHSLTLLSHMASLFSVYKGRGIFLNHRSIVYTNFINYMSLYYNYMTLNSIPSVGMSVLWGWFKRKQVGLSFRRQNY